MNDTDLKTIEQENLILEVAVELGIKVRGNMGYCFRGDQHDSAADEFSLFFNLVENSFFCRTCTDVGGTVADLVCQCRGWDRQKALQWLAHRIEFDRQTREQYYHQKNRR